MTSKERWTVYPLLLLAIGLAVRGNAGSSAGLSALTASGVRAEAIVCKELRIITDDDRIIVHAGRVEDGGGGRIEIRDADGHDALGLGTSPESRNGAIEFFDAEGKSYFRLAPNPAREADVTP